MSDLEHAHGSHDFSEDARYGCLSRTGVAKEEEVVFAFHLGALTFGFLLHHEGEVLYLLPDFLYSYILVKFLDRFVEGLFPILSAFHLIRHHYRRYIIAFGIMLFCNSPGKVVGIVTVGVC